MPRPLPDDLLTIPHRRDVPFPKLTTLGVGGFCRWLFEPVTDVGEGIKVAAVRDPFGNRLGIIENPHFNAAEVR